MPVEDKVSKICWNSNNWQFPSGSEGKSPSSKSFESKYGFGHEEWLFDISRVIKGYHYAFLQPLHTKMQKHAGKTYNIHLYTTYDSTQYYVGRIKQAICISKDESESIYKRYKKNGWIQEMKQELVNAGVNPKKFINTSPDILFNLKFDLSNFEQPASEEMEEISKIDINITTPRYKLLPLIGPIQFIEFSQEHEGSYKNTQPRTKTLSGDTTIDPIHDKMQNALCKFLREKKRDTYKKVDIERNIGRNRVDIKALTHSEEWHYFEIKTDNPKLSIRKGIGQLFEYAFFPDAKRADKLIIVSSSAPTQSTIRYLSYLRLKFSIPLHYCAFDLQSETLSEEY